MQYVDVVACASRQLKDYETHDPTHDIEFAAVVFFLKNLNNYLYVFHSDFYTNHKSLNYILTQRDSNMRRGR